jgi:hypothetical protein
MVVPQSMPGLSDTLSAGPAVFKILKLPFQMNFGNEIIG